MQRRSFGQTGLAVPILGFGAMQAGDPALAEDSAARLLNHALDIGLTLIDTARSYGVSEERIGRHLGGGAPHGHGLDQVGAVAAHGDPDGPRVRHRHGDRVDPRRRSDLETLDEPEHGRTEPLPLEVGLGAGEHRACLPDARLLRDARGRGGVVARDHHHAHAGCFQRGDFFCGGAASAGDDRARMSHALACRCSDASDKAHDGLFHVVFAPARSFCFVGAANFTDHDHGIGVWVVVESAHHVDVLQTVDGVTTNADSRRLAQTDFGKLRHSFISQGA